MSDQPTLTTVEIARAATNDPALSTATFSLGNRTFSLVDLPYDDYLKFLAFLQPLFDTLTSVLTGGRSGGEQAMTPADILKYCAGSLPEMVHLMCKQTDPLVTVEDVKRLGKNPFTLASVVLRQVDHNAIIEDISNFFDQIVPMINRARK